MPLKFTAFRGASFPSAIDDFTVTTVGDAASAIAAADLREALGYAEADRWRDGAAYNHRVDGVQVSIRRDGWRIVVWGDDVSEPPRDPLPMPEGGEPLGPDGVPVPRPAARFLTIAPTCADGSPWPPIPQETPEAKAAKAAEIASLMVAAKEARAAGLDRIAEAAERKAAALLGIAPDEGGKAG